MGLSDEYKLPKTYNEAYHLMGDGVAVPVVRYLAENLLEPIILSSDAKIKTSRTTDNPLREETRSQRAN